MTLKLFFHPVSPPSRAILVLADLLKLKLDKKIVKLNKLEHLTPEFEKINPNKVIPVLVDHDKTIRESRAILTYMVNKYSPNNDLYPVDPYKRSQVDSALFFEACHIYGPFEPISIGLMREKSLDNKFAIITVKKNLNKLNNLLEKQKFVAGNDFSIADISLLLSLSSIEVVGPIDVSSKKNIMDWKERVKPFIPNYDEYIVKGTELLKNLFDSFKSN